MSARFSRYNELAHLNHSTVDRSSKCNEGDSEFEDHCRQVKSDCK